MKNFIQPGAVLTVAAPSGGVVSGAAVKIGALFGVAATSAAEGADVEIAMTGVFELPKATGQTWSVGDPLYWDAEAGKLTKTAANNPRVATATKAAGSSATTGYALIGPAGVTLSGLVAPQDAIADLADITGGEAPTEAEHNAVRAQNRAILAAMRGANMITE